MATRKDRPVNFPLRTAQDRRAPFQQSPRFAQGAARPSTVRDFHAGMPVPRFRSDLNRIGGLLVVATFAAIVFTGCSSGNVQSRTSSSYHAQTRVGSRGNGRGTQGSPLGPSRIVASWYGPGYEGHRTANGEGFNPNGFTAASKTLPLGSIVRVTNLQNGRWVDVRINDRGPVAPGRSIDLSSAAAQRIGLTKSGVARVRVTRISE
jgi:rare lipoprotein A